MKPVANVVAGGGTGGTLDAVGSMYSIHPGQKSAKKYLPT
jgi:hypothetical protein